MAGDADRGRRADNPAEIPRLGWKDIAWRAKEKIGRDQVPILAAGTAFYFMLSLVPGLAALVSIYGLAANPADIQTQFSALSPFLPVEVKNLLEQQLISLARPNTAAGWGASIGMVAALWGASAATKTLIVALNGIYGEKEKRTFVQRTMTALGLTLGAIFMGVLSVGVIVFLPIILATLGLDALVKSLIYVLRWLLLVVAAMIGVAVLYRFGPSREKPQWKWVSPGAMVATILWIGGSALFALYTQRFGNYNQTYGALGAIVVLLLWLLLSSFSLLLGAALNAEIEHQTEKDTTTGPTKPIGGRGATMADTVGEQK